MVGGKTAAEPEEYACFKRVWGGIVYEHGSVHRPVCLGTLVHGAGCTLLQNEQRLESKKELS